MDLKNYIRDIPDFPKPGILFRDITPLLADPKAFGEAVDAMHRALDDKDIRVVAGIESRGFFFAGPLALRLGASLVPVRKKGKLPHATIEESYDLEYGTDQIEIHEDAIPAGSRVAVVDDVLATGGTLAAACRLVEKAGGEVAAAVCLMELSLLKGREKIKWPLHVLLRL